MWIATTIGFYSIVYKRHHQNLNKKLFVVRARTRGDIERLAEEIRLNLKKEVNIYEYEKSDYQFRVYLETQEDFAATLAALAKKVTYPNFKDEISETPHQAEKVGAYANLWLKLFMLTHKRIFNESPS